MTSGGTEEKNDLRRLDLVGLLCPLPVLKARRALARLSPGDRIEIVASDPLATIDIPHMCMQNGHRLVDLRHDGTRAVFVVERGEVQENEPENPEI